MKAKSRPRRGGPERVAPSAAPAEAAERVLRRRQLRLHSGDVVIYREPLPRVNPRPVITTEPQWRYRVTIQGDPKDSHLFTGFVNSANYGEQLATERQSRLMFVEEDVATMLADYRPAADRPGDALDT